MLKLSFFRGLFYGLFFSSVLWAGIFFTVKSVINLSSVEMAPQAEVVSPQMTATPLVAANEL